MISLSFLPELKSTLPTIKSKKLKLIYKFYYSIYLLGEFHFIFTDLPVFQVKLIFDKMQDLESLLNQNNTQELKEAIQDPDLAVGYC